MRAGLGRIEAAACHGLSICRFYEMPPEPNLDPQTAVGSLSDDELMKDTACHMPGRNRNLADLCAFSRVE
ncbi:hypothetical protein NDU88_000823 [Pleurodeles waltl]|uniref:Uncharacterized protein n=1 Tax=Pleurodeles waltl TaxID=8319 RepID=A0AAV7S6B1_PLEWA|nr:hypothetical protein NDU88_000823 [Pleurodeles waltl]